MYHVSAKAWESPQWSKAFNTLIATCTMGWESRSCSANCNEGELFASPDRGPKRVLLDTAALSASTMEVMEAGSIADRPMESRRYERLEMVLTLATDNSSDASTYSCSPSHLIPSSAAIKGLRS